jgi:hypothetical protein
MKNQLFSLLFFASLFSCQSNSTGEQTQTPTPATPAANVLTEEEKAAGWKLLFDGTTTNGWRGYNRPDLPKAGWVVKDGELIIEKTPNPKPADFGGDIITAEQYGNFELSLDFMISDTANSGIFYLIVEEKDSAMWHNAPEYQIIDDEAWTKMDPNFNMDTHRTGDNYDMQASSGRHMKPVGEWNTARIVHNNGRVEHWLNGQKCLEYQVGSPEWNAQLAKSKFKGYPLYCKAKQGHLGLQDHGHEVRFKNIKVRSL